MMGIRAHDQIVTLPAPREIFLSVINDMVCANRSRDVYIPGAAHGSDFRPERFGDLDRKCTHTARRAINQNLVAWLDPSLITKTLKRGDCRHWYSCCVLKRSVGWLPCQLIFNCAHILGKASHTFSPEHRVAWLKLLYVSANRFNSPRDISADYLVFWCAQPRDQADQRRTSHHIPVKWIYRCCINSDQDLIVGWRRCGYLREL